MKNTNNFIKLRFRDKQTVMKQEKNGINILNEKENYKKLFEIIQ